MEDGYLTNPVSSMEYDLVGMYPFNKLMLILFVTRHSVIIFLN